MPDTKSHTPPPALDFRLSEADKRQARRVRTWSPSPWSRENPKRPPGWYVED